MIWLLLFIHIATSNGQCNFPDLQYIAPNLDNVNYIGDSCTWNCNDMKTGRGCTETCNVQSTNLCGPGMRRKECNAPSAEMCIACAQTRDEAKHGGYSFDTGSGENLKYDLLRGMGSFDNAKIYPKTIRIRNAVNTNASTYAVVPWADILFPGMGLVSWSGTGKVDIHYEEGKGAMQSDVFAVLTAPFAMLKACSIQTRDERSSTNANYKYINGLVY